MAWHKNSKNDRLKDKLCNSKDIILYRVRDYLKSPTDYESDTSIIYNYKYQNWDELSSIIICILIDLSITNYDVNIERDMISIKESYYNRLAENSLSEKYPEIAAEWHPTNNGKILPTMVFSETHDIFDWLCPNGHTYKASVENRVRKNSGCPYCAGQKVQSGFSDLATTNPLQALDYDNDKNERKSTEISKGSSEYVWWKCHKCGYEYKYQLSLYIASNYSCPRCSNDRTKTKFQKVLNYETGQLFETTIAAAKSLDLPDDNSKVYYKNIAKACSDKSKTHIAYGYHWFYVLTDFEGNIIEDISKIEIDDSYINSHYKSHIGETYNMAYGQTATIIAENGASDVTIQFNDGTIVEHCIRSRVYSGNVKNPNYVKPKRLPRPKKNKIDKKLLHIGETNIMKDGSKATIVEYISYNDINIQFEDGTIIEHTNKRAFTDGHIKNPNKYMSYLHKSALMQCGYSCTILEVKGNNIIVKFDNEETLIPSTIQKFINGTILSDALSHNYKYRTIGERKKMRSGEYATLIADRGSHDIDVQFDDGTIVEHRDRKAFEEGGIKNPSSKTNYVGKTNIMRCGLKATVIEDKGWNNITVQFEDGFTVYNKRRSHFDVGNISHK